jgi:DNA-binding IclR family transcriptional regulator
MKSKKAKWVPSRAGHLATANIIKALTSGEPQSVLELAELSGLHRLTVGHLLRAFRREDVARIAAWDADTRGRVSVGMWVLGSTPDAKRPPPAARSRSTIRSANFRARKKMTEMLGIARNPETVSWVGA